MLILLIVALLIAAGMIMYVKKTRESIYLLGMCLSLLLQFCGILIFISKKGGYSSEILQFLYFSTYIKTKVQYLFVTLGQIGYLIALGRYLFPLFLMLMALSYSMIPIVRHNPIIKKLVFILPTISLLVYYPTIYSYIVESAPWMQDVIVRFSYIWILVYVAIAMLLLIYEYFSITMRFCRRQFSLIIICMAALSGLYILYCGQDPGQVYRFYSYGYTWNKGIGYLQYAPSMGGYITLVVVNIICCVLGFTSLLRYTQGSFETNREEVVLERKFDIARTGASVFVHSIKNQLLANRVLYKRLHAELQKDAPDIIAVSACVDNLQDNNELLITRSEELYKTVKSKSVRLVPVPLDRLEDATLTRFYKKYPEGKVEVSFAEDTQVLADENYLSEALYNLLTNAYEANIAAGNADIAVQMLSHSERLYTVLEIKDNGTGMSRAEQKKIFEPFYSSKNTNFNWGMGLYHVRVIIKSHLGSMRVESKQGVGSSFFVLLPRYTH